MGKGNTYACTFQHDVIRDGIPYCGFHDPLRKAAVHERNKKSWEKRKPKLRPIQLPGVFPWGAR